MSEWVLIPDPSQWAVWKTSLERIPHIGEPKSFPCLVMTNYDCSGSLWKHIFVYQDDAEQLFGAE
jgi:hypothetical protein